MPPPPLTFLRFTSIIDAPTHFPSIAPLKSKSCVSGISRYCTCLHTKKNIYIESSGVSIANIIKVMIVIKWVRHTHRYTHVHIHTEAILHIFYTHTWCWGQGDIHCITSLPVPGIPLPPPSTDTPPLRPEFSASWQYTLGSLYSA